MTPIKFHFPKKHRRLIANICIVIIILYITMKNCTSSRKQEKKMLQKLLHIFNQLRRADFGFSIPPFSRSAIEDPPYGGLPEACRVYLGIFVVCGLVGVGYGLRGQYGLVERSRLLPLDFLSGSSVYFFCMCALAMGKRSELLLFLAVGCFACVYWLNQAQDVTGAYHICSSPLQYFRTARQSNARNERRTS